MGVNSSTNISPPLRSVCEWSESRINFVFSNFQECSYDFSINSSEVMNLTGLHETEANELLRTHIKNGAECDKDEISRTERLFDLMDFNRQGRISMDEFIILLLCIGSSYSFIINGSDRELDESSIVLFAKKAYERMGKRPGSPLKKEEFVDWATDQLFGKEYLNINDIFSVLLNGLEPTSRNLED